MDFIFKDIKKPSILVIGEIILDVNIFGEYSRIKEHSFPIFNELSKSYTLGGAANVFCNLEKLNCDKLVLVAPLGRDSYSTVIRQLLENYNANFVEHTGKNHVFTRYYSSEKLLFRSDIDERINIDFEVPELNHFDIIVISDYNKGFLNETVIQKLKSSGKKIIVDPKNELHKYHNIYAIKPNISEAKQYLGNLPLKELHNELLKKNNCEINIITLDKNGISLSTKNEFINFSQETVSQVIDTTGCGDIVLAVIAYLLINKVNKRELLDCVCWLASRCVSKIGCYLLSNLDIAKYGSMYKRKIIECNDLHFLSKVNNVVFTNGCFDIFHHGHLKLLNFAKKQGDLLIVGLNSDESIKKLKGSTRPINSLQNRLELLSSLNIVDYIIIFSTDTPYDILQRLKPQILVKGNDYSKEELLKTGGSFSQEIRLFPLENGISTTTIVNKINLNK